MSGTIMFRRFLEGQVKVVNKQCYRKPQRKKGLATLAIMLLLLFVATLVTLYTANSTVREQQVSANQYRADQALSAANAGLGLSAAGLCLCPPARRNCASICSRSFIACTRLRLPALEKSLALWRGEIPHRGPAIGNKCGAKAPAFSSQAGQYRHQYA